MYSRLRRQRSGEKIGLRRWNLPTGRTVRSWQRLNPSQLFVFSFFVLIILGAMGFRFLPGLYTGRPLQWQECFFTATSAVCVTGLIVVDTADHFTFWGQAYLLLLIQLGGLGMLTLTSMIIATLGGRLSLRAESIAMGNRQAGPYIEAKRLVVDIVRFTLVIEVIGAILLVIAWAPSLGYRQALWPAMFHSISAFCNAGFSTFSDSLIQFQSSPATTLTISFLIVMGGLGFLSLEEIYASRVRRSGSRQRHRRPMSVQTLLVLMTSAVLTVLGWVLFSLLEWNNSLGEMQLSDKMHNALLMSVTARTAGFNSIDYSTASDSSNFLTILLMMIGGSPGSTAGGMKTTTFALLGLLAWSRLRGLRFTAFAKRSIPDETIQRAVGLFVVATGVVVVAVLSVATLESFYGNNQPFLTVMFEVVSAFNTVGLSMGQTSQMSPSSQWLLIVLMFLGRVGPLALVSAFIVRRSAVPSYRYANEDVIVG
jgi:trk system potassium uptake protein